MTTATETQTNTQKAAELRKQAAEAMARKYESEENSDTDGCLSQWGHSMTAMLRNAEADLAEAGGVHWFPELYDLDGNPVPARKIDAKYGTCWAVVDPATNKFTGQFLPYRPERPTTLIRKGYTEVFTLKPAKVILEGSSWSLYPRIVEA